MSERDPADWASDTALSSARAKVRAELTSAQRSGSRASAGTFVLSLDCEGLWGMADIGHVMTSGAINSATLRDTYNFLERTLDRAGIRATAAFVDAFAAEREVLQSALPELEELGKLQPQWFGLLLPRLRTGTSTSLEGLEGHACWKQLSSAGHEMAWHGSTHMPIPDTTPPAAVEMELALNTYFAKHLNQQPEAIIFPRNQIGHLDRLRRHGFRTYRDSRSAGSSSREKLLGAAREWAVWDHGDPQLPRSEGGWVVSPPGYFLNWRSGLRRTVPVHVTVSRWRSMLRYAARHGRCVHMWFHPHNFITSPSMKIAFSAIIDEVHSLSKTGDLKSVSLSEANRFYVSE